MHLLRPLWLSTLTLALVAVAPLQALTGSRYLAPNTPDVLQLLPPPPVPGSAEARTELDIVLLVHHAAPAADLKVAREESKLTIFQVAQGILGPWFQPGKFPRTEALLREVEAEANGAKDTGKNHWQRLRPYNADPARFPDAIEHEKPSSYSYPSGHSTRATVLAGVFAELFPAQREAFFLRGREIGWLRVEGGVHYPSDIYAGRVLGQAVLQALSRSPAFQQDLAAARAELAAAGH
ncbi:MAG: phosphatase PAP2 family protein [Opitutales bacterium]